MSNEAAENERENRPVSESQRKAWTRPRLEPLDVSEGTCTGDGNEMDAMFPAPS